MDGWKNLNLEVSSLHDCEGASLCIFKNAGCSCSQQVTDILWCRYLGLSHVNASDMTLLAHQLTQHVAVPPTAAAQVQDGAALQALRHQQTAAVVPVRSQKLECPSRARSR